MVNYSSLREVAIFGAGVIGVAVANRLAEKGVKVVLYCRNAMRASIVSSALIKVTSEIEELEGSELFILALPELNAFREILNSAEFDPCRLLQGRCVVNLGLTSVSEVKAYVELSAEVGFEYAHCPLCSGSPEVSLGMALFCTSLQGRRCEQLMEEIIHRLGRIVHVDHPTDASIIGLATMNLSFTLVREFCKALSLIKPMDRPQFVTSLNEGVVQDGISLFDGYVASEKGSIEYKFYSNCIHGYAISLSLLKQFNIDSNFLREAVAATLLLCKPSILLAKAFEARISCRLYADPFVSISTVKEEFLKFKLELNGDGEALDYVNYNLDLLEEIGNKGYEKSDFFSIFEYYESPKLSDKKHLAYENNRDYLNPFRVNFFREYGIDFVMGRREGPEIFDIDGEKKVFDLHCNGGVFNLGHRNPAMIQALTDALSQYDIGNHHLLSEVRGRLAAELSTTLPVGMERIVFGVSGGESIDLALKLAWHYTGRKKVISIHGGFHGHTGFSLLAGDQRYYGSLNASCPIYVQVPFNDIASLADEIDSNTAAVIIETIPATLGFPEVDDDYFSHVRKLCDKSGAQLILDEVQAGWGRTGKFWGINNFDVTPDVLVTAKGMAAGLYPISATCFRPHLIDYFRQDLSIHLSTMGGSEIACAVTLAQIEFINETRLLSHVTEIGALIRSHFEVIKSDYPNYVIGLRGIGLMLGVEYCSNLFGRLMTKHAYENGLLLIYAGHNPSVSQLLPPLTITKSEVEHVMKLYRITLDAAIKSYHNYKLSR